jgi:hypothetical protein
MTEWATERDRIKHRIAKLLNVTLERGASENEAMRAAEKAAELMAHYNIETSELSIRSARAVAQTVTCRKYGSMNIAAPVARHVGQLCDCIHWWSTEKDLRDTCLPDWQARKVRVYTYFGLPADAEIASYLFDLISNAILAEINLYKRSADYIKTVGVHGRTLVTSFVAGMEDRICARLDALRDKKQHAVQEATGRSLVVVKAEQIRSDFEATGIKLRTAWSHGRKLQSKDAYACGSFAGDRLPLSPGVRTGPPARALT